MQFDSLAEKIILEAEFSAPKPTLNKRTKLPRTYKNVFGDESNSIATEIVMVSSKKLISLEGAPKETKKGFYASRNLLTDLKGAPQKVGFTFHCENNKQLITLEGGPQEVGKDFSCSECSNLQSLKGSPQHVGGYFNCTNNQLTSLEGAPQKVGGSFWCSYNQLTSLQGAPQHVEGDFRCYNNPNLPFLELARMDLGNKVKGNIYFGTEGAYETPVDKVKCTRAYYDIVKQTAHEEQEEIGEI